MLKLLLASFLLAATPAVEDEDALDIEMEDLDDPSSAETSRELGGDYEDVLGFRIGSPGPEWTAIRGPKRAPGIRGAFVHTRGQKIGGLIAITADENVGGKKDAVAYARDTFASLTAPPLLFKVEEKKEITIAKRKCFNIRYRSADGRTRYEQLYIPGPKGSIVVLTLQAPQAMFENEAKAFRASAATISFR